MKRNTLLKQKQAESNDKISVIESIVKSDLRFIDRKITDLKRDIEDQEILLEERLGSDQGVDTSVVESMFFGINEKRKTLKLYEEFKSAYYAD